MKKFFVLMCVLAITSTVFAEGKVEEQEKEKPDNRSVVVDAWLVRVSADALYESGVKPFSEKDKENVSVMNLLWCLSDPNNGKIIGTAKTTALMAEEGNNELSYRENIQEVIGHDGSGKPMMSGNYFWSENRITIKTCSFILENKQVRIEYVFAANLAYKSEKNPRPDEVKINSNSITIVSVQKPVIVAQTQIGDDMFFLVLRAEIVD